LPELCREIKEIGKYLSIDTNGSNPTVLKIISSYVNRVALDLKGPLEPEKLERITGVKVDINKIRETFDFLKAQKDIDFEIRTTYVESLLSSSDIENIIYTLRELEFTGNFVLQQYQFSEGVGEEFKRIFSKPEHDTLVTILKPYRDLELPFKIFLRDEIVGYCAIHELDI
jgi:pyruvate formate lyase activating enzyme